MGGGGWEWISNPHKGSCCPARGPPSAARVPAPGFLCRLAIQVVVVEKSGGEIGFICSGALRLRYRKPIASYASAYEPGGPTGQPMGEGASVARSYSTAAHLPEAEGSSRARRHMFFTPTLQQLLHSLFEPTLPATVLYLLPFTLNNCPSSSNLSPYLYHLPVPPTTFPGSLGPCYSPMCLPALKLQYPKHLGYPALPLKRLLLPELN